MASRQELSDFLASIERRAFKHAMFAVRDEDASLDLVQDAMLKLAEKYADKPDGGAADAVPSDPPERDHRTTSGARRSETPGRRCFPR